MLESLSEIDLFEVVHKSNNEDFILNKTENHESS